MCDTETCEATLVR